MNTKVIKGWAILAATMCMTVAAYADSYQVLHIRTVRNGTNMIGATDDQRVIGIACDGGIGTALGNLVTTGKLQGSGALVFFQKDIDFSNYEAPIGSRVAHENPAYRALTSSAYEALCSLKPGDYTLAVYKDRADVLQKVDLQAQSFNDILDVR